MTSLGEKIRSYRKSKGLTQEDLARLSNLTKDYISKVEREENINPRRETMAAIAAALDVQIFDLLVESQSRPPNAIDAPRYTPHDIPVVGLAKAGRGGFFGEDGMPTNEWSRKIHRPDDVKDPHAYAVEIEGDSMEPLARKGDFFLCETDKKARNGDLVVVQTHDDEVMAKLFFDDGRHIVLKSMNSNYEPIVLAHDQIRAIHVVKWVKKK